MAGTESRISLDLDLRALQPGWVDLPVTGGVVAVERAILDGAPVALADRADGTRWLTARLSGQHHLVITGSAATPASQLALPLPGAARTEVRVAEPGWDLSVEGGLPLEDGAILLPEARQAALSWRPEAPPAPKPRVVVVESATAVAFDESGLEGRATLRYRVAHGSLTEVAFRLPGGCDSVQVSGPGVASSEVQGERVLVHLARPLEGAFELQVAFRAPPPADDRAHPAPLVVPEDVNQHEGWLTLARADTAMLVPEPGPGLSPVASFALPGWASALVPGTPVVSYHLEGRSPRIGFRMLRYDPVPAPPTVVDEARYQLATTAHGRALLKARYQVRNDRNQYLRLVPPKGFTVLGVRVAGQVRQPVRDPDGGVFIPLEKSVESLQGLVSFPVDVYLLGKEEAWAARGTRHIATPAVDAPVASARWEVWLPVDVEEREVAGSARRVQQWTSAEKSLHYGDAHLAPGGAEEEDLPEIDFATSVKPQRGARHAARAAPAKPTEDYRAAEAKADASVEVFNQAYQAYNANDFDAAEALLERSIELDPGNASAQALLGNVGVLNATIATGEDSSGKGEDAQARRVRELAQARSVDDQLVQKEVQQKAEEALRAGDYEQAEQELERLEEVTRRLSRLEQAESVEQQVILEETSKKLEVARGNVDKKKAKTQSSSSWGGGGDRTYRFDDEIISGAIAQPQVEAAGKDAPYKVPAQAPPPAQPSSGFAQFDFESLDIEGELVRPDGELLLDRQQADMNPLIQAPQDFDGAILADSYDLGGFFGDLLAGEEPEPIHFGPGPTDENQRLAIAEGALSVTVQAAQNARMNDPDRAVVAQALAEASAASAGQLMIATSAGDETRAEQEARRLAAIRDRAQMLLILDEDAAPDTGWDSGEVAYDIADSDDDGIDPTEPAPDGLFGLLGDEGLRLGGGGLGQRGEGRGGGGTASGMGGIGTGGRGSGSSGFGAGRAYEQREVEYEAPEMPEAEPVSIVATPAVAAPAPCPPPPEEARGRRDERMAQAHGNVVTSSSTAPAPRRGPPPATDAPVGGTTALPPPSDTVTASHLVINLPTAGERLAFEQLLVAENEPLTLDIRYRTRRRP
ncbi:MAG: hypothetical protein ABIO70_07335 [Pseudomonadota bacterium]